MNRPVFQVEDVIGLPVSRFLQDVFSDNDLYEMAQLRSQLDLALKPKLGDHLVKPRPGYTHHGIYVGDDKVIHYAGFADGFNSAPVEQLSLDAFHENSGKFSVKRHGNAKFSPDIIVGRAASRLNENNYNLIWNNCEHFVNWCIYDQHQSHQIDDLQRVMVVIASAASKSAPPAALAASIKEAAGLFKKYIKGDISKEKLLNEVGNVAVSSASIAYYAGFGQVAIPIPVVGALAGATVGYFLGGVLNQSGLIALGESDAVRISRERAEEVGAICNRLVDKMNAARAQIEKETEGYFRESQKEIFDAMSTIDAAIGSWGVQEFSDGLMHLASRFGASLRYTTFDEFETEIMSDKPMRF